MLENSENIALRSFPNFVYLCYTRPVCLFILCNCKLYLDHMNGMDSSVFHHRLKARYYLLVYVLNLEVAKCFDAHRCFIPPNNSDASLLHA